ncbi:MAG: signal peptide peptidase SppA [Pseudomonadota bacterium]|nr:signal peptide peptidase SppA [Pseudomonadota bacterium]
MSFLRFLWTAFKVVVFLAGLGVIGGLVAVVVIAPWERGGRPVPENGVLDLSFEGKLDEGARAGHLLDALRGREMSVTRMVRAIDAASSDGRIRALFIDLSGADVPLAQAEAIGAAVARFRAAGKRSHAWSEGYDLGRYALAARFDEVWLAPTGDFAAAGAALMLPYAGELVDDLGIRPAIEQRRRHKTVGDVLTRRFMDAEVRAHLQAMVDDVQANALETIAAARGMNAVDLGFRLDAALWDPEAALQSGLVDRLAYRTVLEDSLTELPVPVAAYASAVFDRDEADDEPVSGTSRIALIVASGEIHGGGESGPGGDSIAAGRLIGVLQDAADEPAIAGILLRVDSPGGEVAASDAIRETLKAIDKPVVVSMGDVAASGGYMIALGADRVVAQAATITGSIGVVGGKIVVAGLLEDYGIRFETVAAGQNGAIYSPFQDFTPAQRARFAARIDAIYGQFTGMVAEARKLAPEVVEGLAGGRIWSGHQAAERGLVDRVGGIETAGDELRDLLGIAADAKLDLVDYPKRTTRERLIELAEGGFVAARTMLAGPLPDLETVERRLEQEGRIRLLAPEMRIR